MLYFGVQGECSGVFFPTNTTFIFLKCFPKKNISNGRSHFSDKRQSISRHDAIAMYWIRETKTVWHYMALSLKGRPRQNEICFCFPNTNKQSSIIPNFKKIPHISGKLYAMMEWWQCNIYDYIIFIVFIIFLDWNWDRWERCHGWWWGGWNFNWPEFSFALNWKSRQLEVFHWRMSNLWWNQSNII